MTNQYPGNVDWEQQWSLHARHFRDGYVHYPVGEKTLRLKPGPGFGDLSHPTTRLVLRLLTNLPHIMPILDIGCGSGILSLAAAALGERNVYGIDIDPDAIAHARLNAEINGLNIRYGTAEELVVKAPEGSLIALMNMIWSEQTVAWQSVSFLDSKIVSCITSGILKEEKKDYVDFWREKGWVCSASIEEKGWCAFVFNRLG